MRITDQPEWTPEQQEVIDYLAGLDKFSLAISGYMMGVSGLPPQTIRKLLPLAEIAWRDKDLSGALVFHDIETPSPRVEYTADPMMIALSALGRKRCVVPLEPIFLIIANRAKGVQ
jgi:hypothetical protein